jgi:lipopolysaccharide export system protein LptC
MPLFKLFLENKYAYLLVLSLAIVTGWVVEIFQLPEDTVKSVDPVKKHSPDYFSKGYLKKEMDEQGMLKSELFAEEMLHYSDDGMTHMVKPVLTLYNDKSPPWVIQSDTGVLSMDGEDLSLNGQVIINRKAAKGIKQLRIETHNLRVRPKENYAESDEWAKLTSPPHWTEGIGIQMVFKKPISLKLLANVKSYYEIN